MAKLPMTWVSICALRRERKALLETLQRLGVMEVETADVPAEGFIRLMKDDEADGFERTAATAKQALDVLTAAAPRKGGLLASFAGRREVTEADFNAFAEKSPGILQECHRVLALHKQQGECAAELVRIRSALAQLEPWKTLDVPFGFTGTKTAAAFIGTLPAAYTQEEIQTCLSETMPDLPFDLEIVSGGAEQTCVFLITPRTREEEMELRLRAMGFARPPALGGETTAALLPAEDIRRLKKQEEELLAKQKTLQDGLLELAVYREEIEEVIDYYTVRAEKYRVISRLDHSRHAFVVTGYVPAPALPALQREVEGRFTAVVEAQEADPEKAPVQLRNNAFASPAQSITEMYALPLSTDIDPTPVMSFFYYLFFGMMLSDAGYGLLLFLGSLFLIKKFRPEAALKRNLQLFMYCGVSTMLWGLAFGSFFGDAPTIIAATFFGVDFALPRILDPMQDAVPLLVLSLVLGFAQILTGLALKLYTQWKNGDPWGGIFDAGFWITALLGVALLAVGSFLYAPLTMVGAVIAIASAVGLVLTQGRDKKGPMRILSGVASLYDATGYVSDLMSYSRLMALGLTTGAMASVFNMLGSMFGGGVAGAICMTVIFIIGHAITFGLNALGAYVHTLRLQYVELFSKFYEGGGRPFRPFALHSKYVRIQTNHANNAIEEETKQ